MSADPFISRFSPNRTDPKILESIHVPHEEHLERAVEAAERWLSGEESEHLLFVGSRGAGKTHLITLLDHRLTGQFEREKLYVAWLNEDETSVSFLDLLERIYRALSKRYPDAFDPEELKTVFGSSPADAQIRLQTMLLRGLGTNKCLILIENLDSVFEGLNDKEQMAWRAFYQNNATIFSTVATAQRLAAEAVSQKAPFHGFFEIHHMKPFGIAEAVTLLQSIAENRGDEDLVKFLGTAKGRARIHAIRRLSGGNPRLYVILADFINPEKLDELVRPLENLVDEQLTTYYQERLRWLTPLQRKIVEFLCRSRGAIGVKAIAEGLFKTHPSIAAQLKQLLELGYVNRHPIGREALYELAEPLMRLTLQVKETGAHEPLELIVDVLRVWCERAEIDEALKDCAEGGIAKKYLNEVSLRMSGQDFWYQLAKQDFEGLEPNRYSSEDLGVAVEMANSSQSPDDWMRVLFAAMALEKREIGISAASYVIESRNISEEQLGLALLARGGMQLYNGDLNAGLDDLTRVAHLNNTLPDARVQAARVVASMAFIEQDWLKGTRFLSISFGEKEIYPTLKSINIMAFGIIEGLLNEESQATRQSAAQTILGIFMNAGHQGALGSALTDSLKTIADVTKEDSEERERWTSLWESLAAGIDEFTIPLRILRTTVDYLNGRNDEKLLLNLPSEERALIQEVLETTG